MFIKLVPPSVNNYSSTVKPGYFFFAWTFKKEVWYQKCIHQEVHGRSIFLLVSTIKVDRGQSLTKHEQSHIVKWSNYMLSRRYYFRLKDTNKWKRKMGIGESTPCVKNLPSKHENPSFYPQNYVKLEVASLVYDPSIFTGRWVMETESLGNQRPSGLMYPIEKRAKLNQGHLSQRWKMRTTSIWECPLIFGGIPWYTCTWIHGYLHTQKHTHCTQTQKDKIITIKDEKYFCL